MEYESAPLSDGNTCFQLLGDKNSPPIVFVHGLSSPMCIWDRNFYFIYEQGFTVLRYDLYGRGRSHKPEVKYTLELFVRQLKELLDYIGIKKQLTLVGLSMGSPVSAGFAISYPEVIKNLILIAPAGLNNKPFSITLITLPVLGALFYEVIGKKMLIKGVLETLGDDPEGRNFVLKEYEHQMADPMYRYAILSTLKYGPLYGLRELYANLGKLEGKKGALIWGTNDNVVPFSLYKEILGLVPWLSFFPIEGGTHAVNYQKSDIVNAVLIKILSS